MVLNAGKCHFMCLGKNTENETFSFKDTIMNNSNTIMTDIQQSHQRIM